MVKVQIRRSVFETNSSSTHAICISGKNEIKFPKEIIFSLKGEFGWEWECYNNINAKASYLYLAIMSCHYSSTIGECINNVLDIMKKISNWLKKDNIKFKFDPIEVQFSSYGPYFSGSGYIDHGSELNEFVNWAIESKENLYSYLFNSESCIYTGNDNEDFGLKIPEKDYKQIFRKGN